MLIKILGSGCRKCVTLADNTRQALTALGREADVGIVVYQVMMLVAPHLQPQARAAAEQLAVRYLEG